MSKQIVNSRGTTFDIGDPYNLMGQSVCFVTATRKVIFDAGWLSAQLPFGYGYGVHYDAFSDPKGIIKAWSAGIAIQDSGIVLTSSLPDAIDEKLHLLHFARQNHVSSGWVSGYPFWKSVLVGKDIRMQIRSILHPELQQYYPDNFFPQNIYTPSPSKFGGIDMGFGTFFVPSLNIGWKIVGLHPANFGSVSHYVQEFIAIGAKPERYFHSYSGIALYASCVGSQKKWQYHPQSQNEIDQVLMNKVDFLIDR